MSPQGVTWTQGSKKTRAGRMPLAEPSDGHRCRSTEPAPEGGDQRGQGQRAAKDVMEGAEDESGKPHGDL